MLLALYSLALHICPYTGHCCLNGEINKYLVRMAEIPKRSLLQGNGESILSNQYPVLTASGRTEQLSLRTAIDNFMLENFPKFKTESFTIPSEIVDYSGKTDIQAPLFPDVVAKALHYLFLFILPRKNVLLNYVGCLTPFYIQCSKSSKRVAAYFKP